MPGPTNGLGMNRQMRMNINNSRCKQRMGLRSPRRLNGAQILLTKSLCQHNNAGGKQHEKQQRDQQPEAHHVPNPYQYYTASR